MPSRIIPLINGQYYHIYNRGVEKKPIFNNRRDYQRFYKSLSYYQLQGPKPSYSKFFQPKMTKIDFSKKIVEVICFCLMPNHFHFLVKQTIDGGVTEFISKLSNSYTKYFNIKYRRVGPLFQGEFKAVLVESDEQLIHLSRYIHLNPTVSYLTKDITQYEWSSYREYIKDTKGICDKLIILDFFKSPKAYEQFILDQVDYAKQLEFIKHKLIDEV
ncbi:transposase [Candidatus Daviesbacteria bacterium]|nr:transposase [Candidatus Daviesbacteria bacterium]